MEADDQLPNLLITFGQVAGAGATMFASPRDNVVLMQLASIAALAPYNDVAVKGKAAEIFGKNKP
ncbi:hypothetical protein [Mesorhizobium loti]|uniref:hypothetical protein n=1 Tax=Rhizobium loti TaxID=381 RepID=UPI000404EE75|nr:hypothetical protein [Mesorhizobium loti]